MIYLKFNFKIVLFSAFYHHYIYQKWIGFPYAAIQASLNASDRVGWAWQVLAKSYELAPY